MSIRFTFDSMVSMHFTTAGGVLSVRAITQHLAEKAIEELADIPELFDAAV